MLPISRLTSFFFWSLVCIATTFVSLAGFYFYRRQHQLKVRLPGLSIALGLLDLLMIILLFVQESHGLGCEGVLWLGNISTNLIFTLSLMRAWCFCVFSDRSMRSKFRWTTNSKLLVKVVLSVVIYTFILTFLVKKFDSYYIAMAKSNTCYFLIPFWDFIPNLVVYASLRVFLTSKLQQTSSLKGNAAKDYFGISSELTATNVVVFLLLIAYFAYTYHFVDGEIDSELSKAGSILTAAYFASVIFTLTLPVLKVLRTKTHRRKKQKFRSIIVNPSFRSSREFDIRSIWCDAALTRQFREHAQRSLCAENVDFCVEVNAYKNVAASLNEIECPMQQTKEKLYKIFLKIIEEFLCHTSPSEINISFNQKSHILQFKHPECFFALESSLIGCIFDEAQAEIEKVLQDNLGSSFGI